MAKGPEQLRAYRFSLCRAVAWSGAAPANPAQAQSMVSSGKAAAVVIKTGEEAGGTPEEIESWHKEYERKTEDFHSSGFALVHAFHANIFVPSAFGAPSEFGFEAVRKGSRGVDGIWYSDSQHDYITITIAESKHKAGRQSLERVAASAVPAFGA